MRESINAKLIVLGEGPERESLENMLGIFSLKDHVSMPGFAENPWSFMARADVFVLSSEKEAFGLVLVEAMACGIPVVATDAVGGGPRFVLRGGAAGKLVPRDNPVALAEAILEVLHSDKVRNDFIEKGRCRSSFFSPGSCCKDLD